MKKRAVVLSLKIHRNSGWLISQVQSPHTAFKFPLCETLILIQYPNFNFKCRITFWLHSCKPLVLVTHEVSKINDFDFILCSGNSMAHVNHEIDRVTQQKVEWIPQMQIWFLFSSPNLHGFLGFFSTCSIIEFWNGIRTCISTNCKSFFLKLPLYTIQLVQELDWSRKYNRSL